MVGPVSNRVRIVTQTCFITAGLEAAYGDVSLSDSGKLLYQWIFSSNVPLFIRRLG